jgi:outer membrane immunogenic protein
MRSTLLATVSSLALTAATAASAADLPIKAPPPPASAAWSWAGPYVGLSLGAGRRESAFYDLGDPTCCQLAFASEAAFWSPSKWGVTVGGLAGYNWQFGNVVAGIEGDINWIDGKSSATITPDFGGPLSAKASIDWFATVRARLGFTFFRSLIYVTGGWAGAQFSHEWGYAIVPPSRRFSYEDFRSAAVIGGGIEHMLTPNWTVRVEALYADFGDSTVVLNDFGGSYRSKFADSLTVVRGALSWKW